MFRIVTYMLRIKKKIPIYQRFEMGIDPISLSLSTEYLYSVERRFKQPPWGAVSAGGSEEINATIGATIFCSRMEMSYVCK